ncbi:MaoC family dehydratase [Cellulomonas composti]|uniref:Acyl dehydratase n=1 Tax=Cellulomonas composti TaxID=266130 RepID=A0A511JD69_9CELL|nr:MaoC/PaaZ C-terminal domain-containing protein [Cellulomonas composti]GEL95948.1 acyl dehydratase [Cellulomonas composti]
MIVDLGHVPGLGGLYARGAATSGRLAVTRRTGSAPTALPDVTYRVRGVRASLDHLGAYQRLVGESAADTLPAGFVHVLAFPVATALLARSDFPLPLLGMVHLANVVEQRRPVRFDEPLDVVAHARDLRPHRRGTQVDLVVDVLAGDEHVWRGTSTYLATSVRLPSDEPAGPTDPDAPDAPDGRTPFVAPLPTGRWKLAADTGRRYAEVSGDRNPIHLSALSAKALGFSRAIAHGMYTASRLLADVGLARGDAFIWSVEFIKPVLLPGTVAVSTRRADPGFALAAWDPRTSKPHVVGRVEPLV